MVGFGGATEAGAPFSRVTNSLLTEGLVQVVLVDGDGRHGGFGVSGGHAIELFRLRQNAVIWDVQVVLSHRKFRGTWVEAEARAIRNPGPLESCRFRGR